MKQLIISIGLLLLFSASSNAQIQFPNKNGEWYLHYWDPELNVYYKSPFYIEKDTLMDGYKYSIITDSQDRFALRNDSQKVYCTRLNHYDHNEYLLYDFGLNVGDSVKLIHDLWDGSYRDTAFWKVSAIDHEVIGGISRKLIHLKCNYTIFPKTTTWIEGIGSISGPIYIFFTPWFEISYELYCYKENKESKWGACNMLNAKQYSSAKKNLFYDHASSCLMINNGQEKYDLSVYNHLGKLIFSTNQCTDESIDLSWLEKGIYIYNLQVNGKKYSQKFIIGAKYPIRP